jgi:ketosteroid isomerase-like protein
MKYASLLLLSAILLVSVCARPTVDVAAETNAVKNVLDEYVKSVETEDMNLYNSLVCHDSTRIYYGGFGAPILGWDALQKVMEGQNEMLSDTKIGVSDLKIHMSEDGKTAWATSLWELKAQMGGNPITLPIRCTWVLNKGDKGWRIVHFHKSMPAG